MHILYVIFICQINSEFQKVTGYRFFCCRVYKEKQRTKNGLGLCTALICHYRNIESDHGYAMVILANTKCGRERSHPKCSVYKNKNKAMRIQVKNSQNVVRMSQNV